MIRRPPRSTRTDTLFPYTTLFRSEATAVQASGRISPADSGLWNDAQVEAWAPITHFIREAGSLAGMQLAHAGRKASPAAPWDGGGALRSEERRVGKECVSTCRSRWSPYH